MLQNYSYNELLPQSLSCFEKQTFKWSPVCILFLVFYQGKFVEDTKGVIRIYKSKGRQLYGQNEKRWKDKQWFTKHYTKRYRL